MSVPGSRVTWTSRRSPTRRRSGSRTARSEPEGPRRMARSGGRRRCVDCGPGDRAVTDGHVLEDKSHFRGVWVFLEHRKQGLRDVSVQLIGEGRRLADLRGAALTGVLLGDGVDELAKYAIGYGLDRVLVVNDPILEIYRSRPYAQVMAQLIRRHKPELVLYGASKNGRDLGRRLHAILETGLAADCVKFDIDAEGNLDMIRPSFGG